MATATSSHGASRNVVAEARRRRETDGVEHAVDVSPFRRQRVPDQWPVFGHRDVELVHVDAVAELAGRALRERQRPPGPGQHDVGTLVDGDPGDPVRQRRVGQHAGDHDLLALEQSHARQPTPVPDGQSASRFS